MNEEIIPPKDVDARQGYRGPSISGIFDYDPSYSNSMIREAQRRENGTYDEKSTNKL